VKREKKYNRNERGGSVAEFAVVALVFFMIIFGIIEFGRLLYTHNALTDATRRGARYAVLHQQNAPCVKNVVIYGETNINPTTCAPTGPPLINGLNATNIVVQYEGSGTNSYGMNLGTATVTIQSYTFNLSIPLLRRTLTLPAYRTTLTAESAGVLPPDI
jgi:Flp pilus assembly protein TadG